MPAPYPLLDMPPGDFSNMFDYQAINMAAAHNAFIQGINAMVAHASTVPPEKVQPFMIFSLAVVDNIHHHHDLEEQYLFPELEKKLGQGALSGNVEEHKEFVPQLLELKEYLEKVKAGEAKYDATLFVEKIHSFSDIMIAHLNHEIPSLESSRMRAVFTEKELKDIDSGFMNLALKKIEFATTMPLSVVCGNPATPWFPPFPLPLKWATRWWFARKYSEAWEFGPLDLYGNPREMPKA
ncbi:hypothetical protein K435DRAFT_838742 [Dendrothele bispora CBS 962.96]|uniref:Hemerythrin-like domain-containing protein n=1 Tax=Dendrothele bispora (strain CBS 962.96) TaxID=1314807 RepID=A0A4S8M582_DENBC|nr:hypothetical protein K435DRAFT_838742 [Dendrothele bispora CBS 962.96]